MSLTKSFGYKTATVDSVVEAGDVGAAVVGAKQTNNDRFYG